MKIQQLRNDNKRKTLDITKCLKHTINHLINRNNTLEHELLKMEIATRLAYEGNEVYVEAKTLNNRNIIDVYVSDTDTAYEIAVTETKKRFNAKNLPCRKVLVQSHSRGF